MSKRETEVLRLIGDGLSNAEIAKRLFISPKTAEHHVGRIYAKLELRGRGEAAAYAARNLGPETDENLAAGVRRGSSVDRAAFPDLHSSVEELIAEGDKVVCRTIMTGTHDGEIKGIAATGRQVSVDIAEIYRIENGRFVGYWCQADVAGMTRQLTEERPVAAAPAGGAS